MFRMEPNPLNVPHHQLLWTLPMPRTKMQWAENLLPLLDLVVITPLPAPLEVVPLSAPQVEVLLPAHDVSSGDETSAKGSPLAKFELAGATSTSPPSVVPATANKKDTPNHPPTPAAFKSAPSSPQAMPKQCAPMPASAKPMPKKNVLPVPSPPMPKPKKKTSPPSPSASDVTLTCLHYGEEGKRQSSFYGPQSRERNKSYCCQLPIGKICDFQFR